LAREIKSVERKRKQKGLDFPQLRRLLTKDDDWDTYLQEGQILKNSPLAKTLQTIAVQGSKGFYEGKVAKDLVTDVQAAEGILSIVDLENYRPTLRSPLSADVNGFTLVGVPPPSSGGAAIIGAARFLAGYKSPLAAAADTLSIHRMVEAMRHAFAIRMSLSDPAFNTNVTMAAVRDLVTGSYMESLRKLSKDDNTLSISKYGGDKWAQLQDHDGKDDIADAHEGDRLRRRQLARRFGYLEDNGTSHLSVVDKDGNAVAITTSVNQVFGSYVLSEHTGVLLGNTMDDFGVPGRSNYYGLKPAESNFISPGKKVCGTS
jgi:gamma-glutamyltranspeptidase